MPFLSLLAAPLLGLMLAKLTIPHGGGSAPLFFPALLGTPLLATFGTGALIRVDAARVAFWTVASGLATILWYVAYVFWIVGSSGGGY